MTVLSFTLLIGCYCDTVRKRKLVSNDAFHLHCALLDVFFLKRNEVYESLQVLLRKRTLSSLIIPARVARSLDIFSKPSSRFLIIEILPLL